MVWPTVWNTLKVDGIEKRGRETNILKGGKAGSRDGCLKKGAGWKPLTNFDTIDWKKNMIKQNIFRKIIT